MIKFRSTDVKSEEKDEHDEMGRGVTLYRYTGVSQHVWAWFDNLYGNAENRFFRYGFKI
jgi:hypothetical protein